MNFLVSPNYNIYNYTNQQCIIPLGDIRYIIDRAKMTKQNHFYIYGNTLYATNDESYIVTTVQLNEFYPTIYFTKESMDTAVKTGMFENYTSFVLRTDCWIFPADLLNTENTSVRDLVAYGYDILNIPSAEMNMPIMRTDLTIDKFLIREKFANTVNSYLKVWDAEYGYSFADRMSFYRVDELSEFQDILLGKAADGMSIITLIDDNNKVYKITLFKSIFPLNKGDKMNLFISPHKQYHNIFMATFQVIKKKDIIININFAFRNLV